MFDENTYWMRAGKKPSSSAMSTPFSPLKEKTANVSYPSSPIPLKTFSSQGIVRVATCPPSPVPGPCYCQSSPSVKSRRIIIDDYNTASNTTNTAEPNAFQFYPSHYDNAPFFFITPSGSFQSS